MTYYDFLFIFVLYLYLLKGLTFIDYNANLQSEFFNGFICLLMFAMLQIMDINNDYDLFRHS